MKTTLKRIIVSILLILTVFEGYRAYQLNQTTDQLIEFLNKNNNELFLLKKEIIILKNKTNDRF
jgi:predicted negative regulator of RcsB-dependent stress response